MSENKLALGVDFGGTSVKVGVVSGSRIIESAPPIATQDFDGPEPLLLALKQTIDGLRTQHPDMIGIGVGMPGFVDFENGIIHNLTNVRGWRQYPLKEKLEALVNLPVVADNDANCMAYAEWKQGAGRGIDNMLAITLGTGVGGGVICNGQMVRGSHFGAGEVGQTSIDWQGIPGHYGNQGALEEYIGNQQITANSHDVYSAAGHTRTLSECTPKDIAEAAEAGDEIALGIWDDVARRLATALMNCCWLLNPAAIVIGGGVSKAGDVLFKPLSQHLHRQLSGPFKDELKILPARFGNEAGAIGAAAMALEAAGIDPATQK